MTSHSLDLKKNMKIHCIGDSHVSLFAGENSICPKSPPAYIGKLSQFICHRLGPVLAYNIMKPSSTTDAFNLLSEVVNSLPAKSWILLCCGEIDCRAHLIKQSEIREWSYEQVVIECIKKYTKVHKYIENLGHNLIFYNVIPSARKDKIKTKYPTYGNCKMRNEITRIFNLHLKKYCKVYNIPFVDTFDLLIDNKGLTNKSFYRDRIHLSNKALPLTIRALNESFSL